MLCCISVVSNLIRKRLFIPTKQKQHPSLPKAQLIKQVESDVGPAGLDENLHWPIADKTGHTCCISYFHVVRFHIHPAKTDPHF